MGLIIHLCIGLTLVFLTIAALGFFKGTAESEMFGWLSITGAGASVALMGLLAIVIGADVLWFIFFLLWVLKKKMHLKDIDKTLRLP